jgi:FlaA1/EpsC-like NDP-sugar epimerase
MRQPVLEVLGGRVLRLAHSHRRAAALTIYGLITAVAFTAAFALRFEFDIPLNYRDVLIETLPILLLVRVGCNLILNLSTRRWRFASIRDVLRMSATVLLGSAVFFVMGLLGWIPRVPSAVIIIESVLSIQATAGLWVVYRTALEQVRQYRAGINDSRRVLIVGAGEAGSLLAREMMRLRSGALPVGFVDDDPVKIGATIHGLRVHGGTRQLRDIVTSTGAEELVIAIPSANAAALRRIVEEAQQSDLEFKVLPGIAEVLAGNVKVDFLRKLRIEDLLGRPAVSLELPDLYYAVRGQSVLITGAAGSIGSELSRQIALHEPGTLVLFDQSETALFYLESELRELHPESNIVPVIGDVVDRHSIERVFATYSPTRVYHAAAYKHVPMMEANARESIRNNAIGTVRVAEAAGRHGTKVFVLVSTDKAVNPRSVMGASKRLAEMAILELQRDYPSTTYQAVRFGNVLGSAGSVIPIFEQQIRSGKPLTVTHPDATRYFMTIPEAVQLILKASLLKDVTGRIVMLDMGEPVRIVELAKNLLSLAGIPHRGGQGLVFTGLREGEKLHEQLVGTDEVTTPTTNPQIRMVESPALALGSIRKLIASWEVSFDSGSDENVLEAMAGLFPDLEARERLAGISSIPLPPPRIAARIPSGD